VRIRMTGGRGARGLGGVSPGDQPGGPGGFQLTSDSASLLPMPAASSRALHGGLGCRGPRAGAAPRPATAPAAPAPSTMRPRTNEADSQLSGVCQGVPWRALAPALQKLLPRVWGLGGVPHECKSRPGRNNPNPNPKPQTPKPQHQ